MSATPSPPNLQTPTTNAPARPVLRELKCPQCGSPLPQYSPDAQTLVCPTCHSYVTEDEAGLSATRGSKLPHARVPIRVGQRVQLNDLDCFVMGRVVYMGWEADDTSDTWTWNEWLLGVSDGRLLWLSFDDEEGFYLFNKLRIREQFDPRSDTAIPVGEGKHARVTERYPAKIVGAEGELTWKAARGDRLYMVEGAGMDGKKYSVQVSPNELEIYEGTALPKRETALAFGGQTYAQQVKADDDRRGWISFLGGLCIIFAVAGFIIAAGVSGSGERVLDQTVRLDMAATEVVVPVEFNQAGRPVVIRMTAQGQLPENSAVDINVEVMSPDETETEVTFAEFWHETGIDEGEFWREMSTSGSDTFVPFQAGRHQIQFSISEPQQVSGLTMRVEVIRNHIAPAALIFYGIVSGIIGLLLVATGGNAQMGKVILWVVIIGGIIGVLMIAGVNIGDLIFGIFDAM